MEWDKESLKYFVDDEMTSEITRYVFPFPNPDALFAHTRLTLSFIGIRFHVPIIPRWPFFLILNTAVSPFG